MAADPSHAAPPSQDDNLVAVMGTMGLGSASARVSTDLPLQRVSSAQPPPYGLLGSRLSVHPQPLCSHHRWLRSGSSSHLVERPERLRAVHIGLACGIARVEQAIRSESAGASSDPVIILQSRAQPSLLEGRSLLFVHSPGGGKALKPLLPFDVAKDPDGLPACPYYTSDEAAASTYADAPPTPYLSLLQKYISDSPHLPYQSPFSPHPSKRSEVPPHLDQGDLYFSPGTLNAIQGAAGAVMEAVDSVTRAARDVNGASGEEQGDEIDGLVDAFASARLRTPSPPPRGPLTPRVLLSKNGVPSSTPTRAFVPIRPPGHHCGERSPSGFCMINNVAVAAAHAHIRHGVNRVVVLDIDLHHGNGTQELAWRINEEARRFEAIDQAAKSGEGSEGARAWESESTDGEQDGEMDAEGETDPESMPALTVEPAEIPLPATPPPESHGSHRPASAARAWRGKEKLKLFYGSLHDIESYPCEDGDMDKVKDASLSIAGAHGQWIENVHLESFSSPAQFSTLYEQKYAPRIFGAAEQFVRETAATQEETIVFVSAGYDACQHEYPTMQRHGKSVPVSFYSRFFADACRFADCFARGKLVAVLEGGYSDRALTSGAAASVAGLCYDALGGCATDGWWDENEVALIDKAFKRRRGKLGLPAGHANPAPTWLRRAFDLFEEMEAEAPQLSPPSSLSTASPPSSPQARGGLEEVPLAYRPYRRAKAPPATDVMAGGTSGRTLRDRGALKAPTRSVEPIYHQPALPAGRGRKSAAKAATERQSKSATASPAHAQPGVLSDQPRTPSEKYGALPSSKAPATEPPLPLAAGSLPAADEREGQDGRTDSPTPALPPPLLSPYSNGPERKPLIVKLKNVGGAKNLPE